MAAADALKALEVPGKLIIEVSGQALDVTAAYPYGGTDLGLVKDVAWRRDGPLDPVTAEEIGGGAPPVGIVDQQYLGEAWFLAFALRTWDNDDWSAIFPNTDTGTLGGFTGLLGEGSILPGHTLAQLAVPILFVPEDVSNHPAVYLPLAIPEVAETLEVALAHSNEFLILAGFRWIFEATAVPQVQLLEDLSL